MHPSYNIFLVNDSVRAIRANYEDSAQAKRVLFKTLDTTLQVGDIVVVPSNTRHKFTTCKVVELNAEVDFNAVDEILWIVSRVDKSEYDQILAQEETVLATIRKAQIARQKAELRATLVEHSADALKLLPIATSVAG